MKAFIVIVVTVLAVSSGKLSNRVVKPPQTVITASPKPDNTVISADANANIITGDQIQPIPVSIEELDFILYKT